MSTHKKGFTVARPLALTDFKKTAICGHLMLGLSEAEAFRLASVDRMTVKRACKADPAFKERFETAALRGKARLLKTIQQGGKKNWTHAAWFLERKYWQQFARRRADAYSPEQFNLFAVRLSNLVRQFVPAAQRKAFDAALEAMMAEMAREAAEQRAKA